MWPTIFKHWKRIVLWGFLLALLSVAMSLFFPRQYRAESDLLLLSRGEGSADPYTQAKSAERIGQNLAQVIGTADFFNQVLGGSDPFERRGWQSLSPRAQRRAWRQDVQASMRYNSNLLHLTAYSDTPADAVALSEAILKTIVSRSGEYGGGATALRVVNPPLVSAWLGRPNLLVNGTAGFMVGGLLAVLWVVRYRRRGVLGQP